ncbi:MAG TPA: isoprenylcysteine carboxylmethyltransferase family protein, partial [Bacteroidota bacterium]|nr:isoprenylcysteine carboxylmethyltransferase family protein [Bacteroidota bacterium]
TNFSLSLPSWTPTAGLVGMTLGSMLALACVATFVSKGRGTAAPFDPPREFVVVGPYKYVRNPMYWGAFFTLVGFGLYHHSVSMILFCLLPAVLVHLFVVFIEEKGLEQRFGDSYRDYKRTVNRWLPKYRTN